MAQEKAKCYQAVRKREQKALVSYVKEERRSNFGLKGLRLPGRRAKLPQKERGGYTKRYEMLPRKLNAIV